MRVRLTTWIGVLTLAIGVSTAVATRAAVGIKDGGQVQGPVRVGGDISEPKKIRDLKPVYPADAQAAGIQGLVILEAVIGTDGAVRSAKVLRGQPLLDEAAVGAVVQWRYTPTLLNGEPVEVVMTVTVNFTLGQSASGEAPTGVAAFDPNRLVPQAASTAPVPDAFPHAVRVGGDVKEPKKIRDMRPVYPQAALDGGVQGIVILEIVVDPAGKVAQVKILRGQPLLDDAAINAVAQWEYTPTLLNGEPVPIRMTVTVNFTLS